MSIVFKNKGFSLIDGDKSLVRDSNSKAVLNVDETKLLEHRRKRKALKDRMQEIKSLNDKQMEKISSLEKDVEVLKELVSRMMESR